MEGSKRRCLSNELSSLSFKGKEDKEEPGKKSLGKEGQWLDRETRESNVLEMNKMFKELGMINWVQGMARWSKVKTLDWAWFGNVLVIDDLDTSCYKGVVGIHVWLEWV